MSANVDQKRVLKFNSLEAFNAVSNTLEYPGLFMIGDTSKSDVDGQSINRTAVRGSIEKIADAEYGDILLVNESSLKMITVTSAEYNLTDYPFETFKPIAVCIYDKASNDNNLTVFLSAQYVNSQGEAVAESERMTMGDGYTLVPVDEYHNWGHTINTKIINEKTLPVAATYGINGIIACSKFNTIGTKKGDWYLPSAYDFQKYSSDVTVPNASFSQISTLLGDDYLKKSSHIGFLWTANQNKNSNDITVFKQNIGETEQYMGSFYEDVRAVFIPQLLSD